ncbi:phosphatase PAP2 family protein [Roseomonas xinghualingensis]|uniref:phosphatase PAP2 family protein n=1 Tax=Roseomonas xinghualingensis TaxID=2986475 RepID=UPI0021F11C54|nr:phosphatase PAP2 family protein [Roseomonas sp. SXEYE001]MCV4209082.1 phosphatase PAP2 family protein [Roseomonas sp. SXEYE001]
MERWTLIAIALTAAALLVFANIAAEVIEGDTRAFDEHVLLALRSAGDPSDPIGPPWFEEIMRDFTALGGTGILVTMTLAVLGFLLLTGKRQAAAMVFASVATGLLLSHALKWGFDRPRPDLVPHGASVYTQSFPSGHAMLSAIVYLTLGALLARVQTERRVKAYLLLVATLLSLIVGASRVYLGVHWPTDVLAGWAIGAAWALLCWLILLRLQRRNLRARRPSLPEGGRMRRAAPRG